MYNGVINVYKEAGFTSHDVVAKLRGIFGQRKIGHTGTLDPAATGVLPVCLGSATKLCDLLADQDKEYVAELLLGVRTDTQDMTGQVLEEKEVKATEEQVREAVLSFQGEYLQVPPMYSALKVNGKKLYELARAGKEVERQARSVMIHEVQICKMELPLVRIRVRCSKGTYIRTLCEDIGKKLGCGATMSSLVRTRVGFFQAEDAYTLAKLQELKDRQMGEGIEAGKAIEAGEGIGSGETIEAGKVIEAGTGMEIGKKLDLLGSILIPTDACFPQAPALHAAGEGIKLLQNGNPFQPHQTREKVLYQPGHWVRIYDEEDRFYGIYALDETSGCYRPVKMFL